MQPGTRSPRNHQRLPLPMPRPWVDEVPGKVAVEVSRAVGSSTNCLPHLEVFPWWAQGPKASVKVAAVAAAAAVQVDQVDQVDQRDQRDQRDQDGGDSPSGFSLQVRRRTSRIGCPTSWVQRQSGSMILGGHKGLSSHRGMHKKCAPCSWETNLRKLSMFLSIWFIDRYWAGHAWAHPQPRVISRRTVSRYEALAWQFVDVFRFVQPHWPRFPTPTQSYSEFPHAASLPAQAGWPMGYSNFSSHSTHSILCVEICFQELWTAFRVCSMIQYQHPQHLLYLTIWVLRCSAGAVNKHQNESQQSILCSN